jgi:O-acetyl-ADP-ribose deacetylase (regulator of RNase III)
MPTEYRTGDLFLADDLDALAHGCNCQGSMDGGIAVQFRRQWPEMYEEYRARCLDGRFRLGEVFPWRTAAGLVIFNLATQYLPGADARLDAVEQALGRMVAQAGEMGVSRIGMPRIGAGIGGLQWEDVRQVMEEAGSKTSVGLVVFSLQSGGGTA